MIDVETPFSDGWWFRRLVKAMHTKPTTADRRLADPRRTQFTRQQWLDLLWAYHSGEPPLPRLSWQHAEATREFLRLARANYALLSIEAMLDRIRLLGVRTRVDGDLNGDDLARRIQAANGNWFVDALQYSLVLSTGYVIVGPPAPGSDLPLVTAEDPRQVITINDPANPAVARAGLKIYFDEDVSQEVAHVFLPANGDEGDRVRVAVRDTTRPSAGRFSPQQWDWDEERSGELEVQGLGVPVVPLVNRLGMGEFEPHLDLLDRINNMIADRLWTSKYQTFRQRALEDTTKDGEGLPETDESGNEIDYSEVFKADPGALWELPAGFKIWESQATDLTSGLTAARDDVKEFAAVTRTPLYMFSPDAAAGSAEGASLSREGLVFKSEDRMQRMDPAIIRVYRLAFAYANEADRAAGEITTMWAPAERYSLQQRGAAAVQAKTSGVPQRSILSEVWQFDPATVARMDTELEQDALLASTNQDPPPPAAPAQP